MPDVICYGEALIDFVSTEAGVSLIDAPAFQKAPGGAPANVAVGLSRMGVSAGLMGKLGDDPFGHFLVDVLIKEGVDTSTIRFSTSARTALAFVSLQKDGDRDFMFYRHPSADMLFTPEEVDQAAIRSAQVFHFGSVSLIGEPSRSAAYRALGISRERGLLVSYDPNLRFNLWPEADSAKEQILKAWDLANIIKISQEELIFLTGMSQPERGGRRLWHDGLRLLVITQGRDGCTYITPNHSRYLPGFRVETVDTTGAGDAFVAAILSGLLAQPDAFEDEEILTQVCRFANAAGAITTTKRGAIPALPTKQTVLDFLDHNRTEG